MYDELKDEIDEYYRLCDECKKIEQKKEILRKELLPLIQIGFNDFIGNYQVHRYNREKTVIDYEQLKLDYPDIAKRYSKTQIYRYLKVEGVY